MTGRLLPTSKFSHCTWNISHCHITFIKGLNVPNDPAELEKLIKFLEQQLAAGLSNGRR